MAGFLLLLAFDTAAQVGIKLAGERIDDAAFGAWLHGLLQEPLIYFVLACYAGAFLAYLSLLKEAPVGPVYAAAHGHIVTVLIIAMLFFGETLSLLQGIGAGAIFLGVTILALTETSSTDEGS